MKLLRILLVLSVVFGLAAYCSAYSGDEFLSSHFSQDSSVYPMDLYSFYGPYHVPYLVGSEPNPATFYSDIDWSEPRKLIHLE